MDGGTGDDCMAGGQGDDELDDDSRNGCNDSIGGGHGRNTTSGGSGIDKCRNPSHAPGCSR
jgi:Ca2+-binding RTX toxin-like protein